MGKSEEPTAHEYQLHVLIIGKKEVGHALNSF